MFCGVGVVDDGVIVSKNRAILKRFWRIGFLTDAVAWVPFKANVKGVC